MKIEKKLRGNVKRYLPVFREYIVRYGGEEVKKVLREGRTDKLAIKLPLNGKDCRQLIKELGL